METQLIKKYESQGMQLLDRAKTLKITDDASRKTAVDFSTSARKAIKILADEFRPDIDKAHQLHKDLLLRLNRLIQPFKEARSIVDKEIQRDYLERERERKEKEKIAREQAEHERKVQEMALQHEAESLIKAGDMDGAESLLDAEVMVTPTVPTPKVEKTTHSASGTITARTDIKVEVVDKRAVITAVFDGKLPDTILDINIGAAKRYAKAAGVSTMQGFRITETAVISGRTR